MEHVEEGLAEPDGVHADGDGRAEGEGHSNGASKFCKYRMQPLTRLIQSDPPSVSLDVEKTAAFIIFDTDTLTLYLQRPMAQFLKCYDTDTLTLYPRWLMAPL